MIGYAEKVAAMKEAIMAIVASLEAHVFQDVLIAQKCHPVRPPSLLSIILIFFQRIIGSRGSGIRKIMKDYDVEIKVKFIDFYRLYFSLHFHFRSEDHQPSLIKLQLLELTRRLKNVSIIY